VAVLIGCTHVTWPKLDKMAFNVHMTHWPWVAGLRVLGLGPMSWAQGYLCNSYPRISSAEASGGENLKLAFTLEVKCPPIMPYSDFPVVDSAASPIYETSTYAIRDTLLFSCDLL
jgi:hypothetical protein